MIDTFINRRGNTTWFSPIFNFIKILRMRNVLSNSRNLKQVEYFSFLIKILNKITDIYRHRAFSRVRVRAKFPFPFHILLQAFQVSYGKYNIIEMALMIAMTIHWSACLEYYVPLAVVVNKELPENYR